MAKRRSTGLSKRDMFGASHGQAGKGDKSRVTDLARYNSNLAEVNLPGQVKMERVRNKLVKHYR